MRENTMRIHNRAAETFVALCRSRNVFFRFSFYAKTLIEPFSLLNTCGIRNASRINSESRPACCLAAANSKFIIRVNSRKLTLA